jgi:hypothetical protein
MDLRSGIASTLPLAALCLCGPAVCVASGDTSESGGGFAARFCLDCHSGDEPQSRLDLSQFATADAVIARPALASLILARVGAREMPPPDSGTQSPSPDEVQQFVRWIRSALRNAGLRAGPAPLRRLNRYEYNTTMRDLLGVHTQAGEGLPADGGGGAGFDNAAETLFLSPVHAEKYLDAARTALEYMARDPLSRRQVFVATPDDNTSAEEAAGLILRSVMHRAFRRPVASDEVQRYLQPFRDAVARDESFDQAVMHALQGVLISPHFLFRLERPNESPQAKPVDDFELATRLSYFLWSSLPDDELLKLAAKGKLRERTVLREQALRMLDERIGNFDRGSEFTKARALAENFIGQWLGTRELGGEFVPDKDVFPKYDYELGFAMRHEPVYLFEHMLVENRPLLDLLDCDYTFLTRELAAHYGIKDAPIQRFGELEYVKLPDESDRGGVLTMAAVLTVSSYPHRTSPVLRGKWILEKLLGTPPPPPLPDVPPLPESGENAAGKTLRERLEVHRRDAVCASCHSRMDPLGFGLEHYDAIGRLRSEDSGKPIDPTGTLPGGATFSGAQELKRILRERKDDFVRLVTGQMLSYALGRGLVDSDYATIEQVVTRLEEHDYRAQELILGIVESVPFRYKPGTSPETAAGAGDSALLEP